MSRFPCCMKVSFYRCHWVCQQTLFLLPVFFVFFAVDICAQNPLIGESSDGSASENYSVNELSNLQPGLHAEEIVKRFGEPDRKREDSSFQTASWYYGESVIFFSQNRVTAWSDIGEFENREQLQRFRLAGPPTSDHFEDQGWINAWTPEKPLSSEEVFDDILAGIAQSK